MGEERASESLEPVSAPGTFPMDVASELFGMPERGWNSACASCLELATGALGRKWLSRPGRELKKRQLILFAVAIWKGVKTSRF